VTPDLSTLPTAAVVAMRRPAATRRAANAELRRRLRAEAPHHATSEPCAVRFPEDVATWREGEARSAAIQAVEWCRALKIKVDLSGPASIAEAA
jgi:hypothetical protein